MKMMKGFRFHPTDEELIEFLQDKTSGRDSLVQFIAQVPEICEFEPWELPGRSALQTGDRVWYFMYPPSYKYRNSKRISRTTSEGYWKPTGNARKIFDPETGVQIGSKKTLVFYEGRCNDKDKTKTCWVMHEYELNNQKTFNLCKLKKKHVQAGASSSEAAEFSQHSLSSLENHVVNTTMSEHVLDPDGSSVPETFNDNSVHKPFTSIEAHAGERSNQHNWINEDEASNLSSNFINHVAEEEIPQIRCNGQLSLEEVYMKLKEPSDSNKVQDPYSTIGLDEEYSNSILTNTDEMVRIERSNQHNIGIAAERFKMPSSLESLADEDLIPMDMFNDGLSLDELLADPHATNNSNCIQDQHVANIEDGEFLNSIFADNNEASLREGDRVQCLAADNEGFSFPRIGMMESSNLMEKSSKRRRLEYDGFNHHVESLGSNLGKRIPL